MFSLSTLENTAEILKKQFTKEKEEIMLCISLLYGHWRFLNCIAQIRLKKMRFVINLYNLHEKQKW